MAVLLLAGIPTLDREVRDAMQAARSPWLEGVMRGASNVGKPAVVFGGLLAVAVLDAEGVAVARAGLLALLPTNLAVEGLKWTVRRVRPDGDRNPANSSFPSSHAANAVALSIVFARRWPRGATYFWMGAALIAFSRVYLNRHYFSDVLAGAALGTVLAWSMPALLSNGLAALTRRFRRGPGRPRQHREVLDHGDPEPRHARRRSG